MGCDIHVHVEFKTDGKWLHYSHPNVSRSYDLFAKMAGVRGEGREIEPIAEPRGLPKDATETTLFDRKHRGSDAHSESWLGGKELAELENWWKRRNRRNPDTLGYDFHWRDGLNFGYFFGNTFGGDWPEGVEDVRFVFWFDN